MEASDRALNSPTCPTCPDGCASDQDAGFRTTVEYRRPINRLRFRLMGTPLRRVMLWLDWLLGGGKRKQPSWWWQRAA